MTRPPAVFIKLPCTVCSLARSPEFTLTFAIGESIKIPPHQAHLRLANPFALLF